MSERRVYLLEKLQVQLAGAIALAVGYLGLWWIIIPDNPQSPVAFVPTGQFAGMLILTGSVLVLGAACALLTSRSRPEGALLGALIGTGGIALRSQSLRGLLWVNEGQLTSLYAKLIVELLLLGVVLVLAGGVIDLVRAAVWSVRDRRIRRKAAQSEAAEQGSVSPEQTSRTRVPHRSPEEHRESLVLTLIPFLRGCFDKDFVQQPHPPRKDQENPPGSDTSTGDFPALFVNALISIILLSLLLRSSQRGQILFALFASFLLGTLAANHFFPRSRSIVSWIVPVLVGIVYYALAANTVGGSVEGWIDVPNYGYVLPIDWVTAGSAGSALGYWIIARMRELRGLQTEGEQKKQEP